VHAPASGPSIALVDDEQAVRSALRRLLQAVGLTVRTFVDCRSFLADLDEQRPDCLILDLHMAGMSGMELLEAMRARERMPPTIVITAHDEPETRERCLRAGALAYLRKPLDSQVLLDSIDQALRAGTPRG
jgi:FixJ family two-component response regulator